MRGREQELYKIGEENKLTDASGEYVWALRDIDLEVQQGEVLGIIGKNGAGKSTLLKILSRVTGPTHGSIKVKGRIASLLEVGTGFHGELTGRENIFLNGAVLGMRRREIQHKFDEIVDFAGVAKYIDTPVKRYSSGMYVRLAFAVAAHLEPEILVVDEVLAVGDAEFQKKAIGKMQDVSTNEGRTVLFVSHNMASIEKLCTKAIILQNGNIHLKGNVDQVIETYSSINASLATQNLKERFDRKGNGKILFHHVELFSDKGVKIRSVHTGHKTIIRAHYTKQTQEILTKCRASIAITKNDHPYIVLSTELINDQVISITKSGYIDFEIEKMPLTQSIYQIMLFIESNNEILDWVNNAFTLEVEDGDFYGSGKSSPVGWKGKTVLINHKISFRDV